MALATQPFAVLLNPNARRVSQSVFQRVSEIVDPDHVYVSQDEATAPSLIRDIVRQGYRTVFTGGGDGTVTQFINQLPEDDGAPRVGILKLGTGNAMAEIVSSGDPMVDLKSYADNPSADDYSLPLCESEGVRFAFAGIGVDGWVLNDYKALQERYRGAVAKRLLHNVSGYFAATFGVSVPRMIARWARRQRAVARITNIGPPAYGIEQDAVGGRVGRTFRPGEVLYEGPANAVMFGTCPYYGYSLRALPFAGLPPARLRRADPLHHRQPAPRLARHDPPPAARGLLGQPRPHRVQRADALPARRRGDGLPPGAHGRHGPPRHRPGPLHLTSRGAAGSARSRVPRSSQCQVQSVREPPEAAPSPIEPAG